MQKLNKNITAQIRACKLPLRVSRAKCILCTVYSPYSGRRANPLVFASENVGFGTLGHDYHYQQDLSIISSFANLYIHNYDIMSIQPHSRQHATPPESFTNPPLTPPPTDEKTTSLVSRIIEEIKNRQEGRNVTNIPWAAYLLDSKGYQELQHALQRDESLCGFAKDKLRYKEP